jgi:4-amino-4-deoxy-L-arabinose transferase-like glycosyltransferase
MSSWGPTQLPSVTRTRAALALIVALGLAVRLSFLAADAHNPKAQSYFGEVAHSLVTGHGFAFNEGASAYYEQVLDERHHLVDPANFDYSAPAAQGAWQPWIDEPVGGPLLLAGLWEVVDRGYYLPLQLLQALVDALCALLLYRISLRLFRRPRAALAAAGLYAVYPPVAWLTTIPYNDIWALDFTIAIVAAYLEAIGSVDAVGWARSRGWLVACGALTGAGLYFRPNFVILPAVMALATITATGRRRTLVRAAVPTAVALLVVSPWLVRDYRVFHTFVFVRSGAGITLWSGLGEAQNDFGASERSYAGIDARMHRLAPDLRPETPAWDNYLLHHIVLPTIESHPLYYAKLVAFRVFRSTLLLYEGGAWQHRGPTFPPLGQRSPGAVLSFFATHPFAVLENLVQPLAFLLAMVTMALTWRRWRRQHVLLLAVLLAGLVPYIIVNLEPRYVAAVAGVYAVWVGLGADLLAGRVRAHTSSRTAAATSS